jgi:hypothetical protein
MKKEYILTFKILSRVGGEELVYGAGNIPCLYTEKQISEEIERCKEEDKSSGLKCEYRIYKLTEVK